MRCVYLDPTSDYFHLAQRNRLTFFREFGDNIVEGTYETAQAEYEWGVYQEYIKIITDNFKLLMKILKLFIKRLEEEINSVRFKLGSLKQKDLNIVVDEILLPLKYLIKHSAFREEQECRMVYIASIDRPEVTMEYGSFLYVEYEPSVKDHLDKIYIAPAAIQHKRYFDNILKNVTYQLRYQVMYFDSCFQLTKFKNAAHSFLFTFLMNTSNVSPLQNTRYYLSLNLTKLTRLIQIALTDAYKIIVIVIRKTMIKQRISKT